MVNQILWIVKSLSEYVWKNGFFFIKLLFNYKDIVSTLTKKCKFAGINFIGISQELVSHSIKKESYYYLGWQPNLFLHTIQQHLSGSQDRMIHFCCTNIVKVSSQNPYIAVHWNRRGRHLQHSHNTLTASQQLM